MAATLKRWSDRALRMRLASISTQSALPTQTKDGVILPSFFTIFGHQLRFEDQSFDGVLLNEVLEHIADEAASSSEIRRVLRPYGFLAAISPNRWFPFEGHGMRLFGHDLGFPSKCFHGSRIELRPV